MLSRFGIEASQAAQYVIAFVIILVLVALFGLVLRRLTGGRLLLPGQDRGRARQPRLGIVDIYDLDRQRQLILLRRDNVEHLLLIGGPNDVVIETNIVRAVGARAPAAAPETGLPAADPSLDAPPRPQIEANGRPSIEAQLAARLGSFNPRPGEDRTEPAIPPAPEPVLKPSAVTLAPAAAQAPEPPPPPVPLRSAPPRPEPAPQPVRPAPQPQAAPLPAPPPSAPPPPPARPASDAFMPRMTGARPAPAPAAPPSQPAAPAPRPPQPSAAERNQDAAVLSDMAKQLEEALKRPPAQPTPTPNRVLPALDTPPAPRPASPRPEPVRAEPPAPEPRREPPRPEPVRTDPAPQPVRPPEPVRPEPPRPAPAPAPAPAPVRATPPPPPSPPSRAVPPPPPPPPAPAPQAGQQPRPSDDPFSVDEIEAEFARLLGRPVGGNGKN